MSKDSDKRIETYIKLVGAIVAVAGVIWGMWTYVDTRSRDIEARRLETAKPFLDRQLSLYAKATQNAAIRATSENPQERDKAEKQFWQLYWGELVMVEDRKVEAAMVKFGRALTHEDTSKSLEVLSLELARAARSSLADSWKVEGWELPDANDPHARDREEVNWRKK